MFKIIKLLLFILFPILLFGQKFKLVNSFQIDTFANADFHDSGFDFVKLGHKSDGVYRTSLMTDIDGTNIRASHFSRFSPRQFVENKRIKAQRGSKFGFINQKGEIAIPFDYDDLGWNFIEGKVLGKMNEQWFFVDTLNQRIPFSNKYNYKSLEIIFHGVILAKNRSGGPTLQGASLLNYKGERLLDEKYESVNVGLYMKRLHDHLFVVRIGKKTGVISLKTGVVVPLENYNLPSIGEKYIQNASRREYGINFWDLEGKPFDTKGKSIIQSLKGFGFVFQEIKDGKKYKGICDFDFNTIIPAEYKSCTVLPHNFMRLTSFKDSSFVVNQSGEVILPKDRVQYFIYSPDDIITSRSVVNKGKREKETTWYNGSGKIILPPFKGTIVSSNPFYGKLGYGQVYSTLAVKKKDSTGVAKTQFYDRTAKLLNVIEYDSVFQYTPSLFLVVKNNKQGLINKKGELVLPAEYKRISPIHNKGRFDGIPSSFLKLTTFDEKFGLADMEGNLAFLTKEKVHKIRIVNEKYLWVVKGNEYQIYEWQK